MIPFWIFIIIFTIISTWSLHRIKNEIEEEGYFLTFWFLILLMSANAAIWLLITEAPYDNVEIPINYCEMKVIRNSGDVVMYNDTLMRKFDISEFDSTKLVILKSYSITGNYSITTIGEK
jgi:hypothetical protein